MKLEEEDRIFVVQGGCCCYISSGSGRVQVRRGARHVVLRSRVGLVNGASKRNPSTNHNHMLLSLAARVGAILY